MTFDLIAAQGNTRSRLEYEYRILLAKGTEISLGFVKELSFQTLNSMQVQLDVLSVDPANDAAGYTVVDVDGGLHTGVSKAQYEAVMFELKQKGLALWNERSALLAQVEICTTQEELDALVFADNAN